MSSNFFHGIFDGGLKKITLHPKVSSCIQCGAKRFLEKAT